MAEDDRQLDEWDPSETKPLDIKRQSRAEWHMMLWLQGKTYAQISEITGWKRNTIWEDLKEIQQQWANTPKTDEDVRTLALMSLRITRAQILETIDEAKLAQAPYNHIAQLFKEAGNIDRTILSRFTQPQNESEAVAVANERSKIVIDFFIDRYGREALDGFQEYYNREKAKRRVLE